MPTEGWLLAVGAYLLGAVPFAYMAGRWVSGIDIRRYGSGNVGAANVWATVSRRGGAATVALDIAKGAAPVLVARWLDLGLWVQAVAGWAAVAGHNWSPYLKFAGGRGAGTGLGALVALAPGLTMVFAAASLVLLSLLRNPPLVVAVSAVFLPLWSVLLEEPGIITVACVGLVALILAKRLAGNPGTPSPPQPWGRRLLYRVFFDRDVPRRSEWVHRRPPPDQARQGDGR
ncbi:MAG: glycerol-3-phosphate acyltransferase [Chloroflexi bacterium]|nr:glycerol-3-phosphate acyltransferase [Chloroflexota bacterium]